MQIAVVVNPTSGKRRGEHMARDAGRSLREQGTAEVVPRALTMIVGAA